jgi:hypothetical protein
VEVQGHAQGLFATRIPTLDLEAERKKLAQPSHSTPKTRSENETFHNSHHISENSSSIERDLGISQNASAAVRQTMLRNNE